MNRRDFLKKTTMATVTALVAPSVLSKYSEPPVPDGPSVPLMGHRTITSKVMPRVNCLPPNLTIDVDKIDAYFTEMCRKQNEHFIKE